MRNTINTFSFILCYVGATILASVATVSAEETVGMQIRNFTDETRLNWENTAPRPLVTYIWYPAERGVEMTDIGIPPGDPLFSGGEAARDAALSENPNRRPLIVMSHGTGGSGLQMMWLGRRLAEAGYIAAAVNHHGNTAAEESFDPRGFLLFWERPKDLSVLIDKLLSDPVFGPAIDRKKIGAAGFSLGGYTVTALSGATLDMAQFDAFCAGPDRDSTCEPQQEYESAPEEFAAMQENDPRIIESQAGYKNSFRDDRISAVVVLAPALGAALTKQSLKEISIPMHFIVGDGDRIAPNITNAKLLADQINGAGLTIIENGVGHYSFLNTCTAKGRQYLPICKDAEGVDRAAVHADASKIAVDHFNRAFDRKD